MAPPFPAARILACCIAFPAGEPPARAQEAPPVADARPNILLVTLDTTRADAIAPWGPGGVAPAFDALAAESLVALRAYAPAPLTFPSHASMLTGLYPFAHGVRDNDLYRLDASARTTARLLRDAGWRTEAVVAATVLRASTGLANGFDTYIDVKYRHARNTILNARRPADDVSSLVLERIALDDPRPWFIWAHYFDPHQPYVAPDSPPRTAPLQEQYDAQVRFLDREFARVLAGLRESGALARTWILVCGDHGEGLRIQQEFTHSYLCEEGTLRIPLFVRRPDGLLRGRLETLATAADVHPTVLSIAGIPLPDAIHGRDLLATFEAEGRGGAAAEALAERSLWFETWAGWHVYGWVRLEGVIAGRFKYVTNLRDELFDVSDPRDPGLEKHNLAAERPEVVRALKQRLAALQAEPVARLDSAAPNLPQEEVSRLMELGYIARSIGGDDTSTNGTLDPREHYQSAVDVEWALAEAAEGRFDGAVKVIDAVVRKYPGNAIFRELLGKILLQAERKAAAVEAFRSALELDPDLVASNFYLGALMRQAGQADEARRFLTRTVELSPVHLEGWLQLRAVHDRAREYDRVLHDTLVIIRLAGSMGEEDGDAIARESLETWLPNVLRRLANDPRLPELVERAMQELAEPASPAQERAREILAAARVAR